MSHAELVSLFLALGLLVGVARALGEVASALRQPAVLGEILAGVLLGPTILGTFWPQATARLFPETGPVAFGLQAVTQVAVVLFLLVAGLEVDLSRIKRQGRMATVVSVTGMLFPFALGFAFVYAAPGLLGKPPETATFLYALFLATALSISALPVIAKILMDLHLFRTDLGMIILAAAIVNDFIGWLLFALVLGLIPGRHVEEGSFDIWTTVTATLAFAAGMLTVGRVALNQMVVRVQAHSAWPAGVLALCLSLALLCGAFAEWIGVHAIFGAFLVGVALGDSAHLRERTRLILHHFVAALFAPLFFASIGLRVNFVESFDPLLCLVVLAIACVGKVLGCGGGAILAGMPSREAWALGFGMNARGAMEIILGLLAREAGLIDDRMLVALVVMALVTSMLSGPLMEKMLARRKPARFVRYLRDRGFLILGSDKDPLQAIEAVAGGLSTALDSSLETLLEAIRRRDRLTGNDLAPGVRLAHARLSGISAPLVGVALCPEGFRSGGDAEKVRAVVVVLTPQDKEVQQIEVLTDLARTFLDARLRRLLLACSSALEMRALLRSSQSETQH
jgi:Kef-type K+ transport system membrane component KefB/mannitol/fructose-specific phosphotransferase system IIA component (Ntr-type)